MGLQAGIRVNPNGRHGALELEAVVRNVSKEVIEFDHVQLAFGGENSEGTVTARGVEVGGGFFPIGTRYKEKLAPGESVRISNVTLYRPGEDFGLLPTPKVRLGENRIGAEGVVVRLAGKKDVDLATGYLDVQITRPKK